MIGIGITTHNRYELFSETYLKIRRFAPQDSLIVVVDDASDVPVPEATFRFEENVGIARAKNKCLELLDDCEHIFLFEDDTYPIVDDWWVPYVESTEPHLMYIFKDFATGRKIGDSKQIYQDEKIRAFTHPRGCMMYMHRSAIEKAGGMDIKYRRWGYEHVDYSNRIYNNGLTTFRFADVANSAKLFYSGDEHEAVASTVGMEERTINVLEMKPKFEASFNSKEYCDYKESKVLKSESKNNVILTSYLTKHVDPQRGIKWEPKYSDLESLIKSCEGHRLVILHDEAFPIPKLPEHVQFIRIDSHLNPYFQRWLSQFQYLRDHPEIENVFCVDATDVQLLKNPFPEIQPERLYVGDELCNMGIPWMVRHNQERTIKKFIARNRQKPLLNCGVVGGSREMVADLCQRIYSMYLESFARVGPYEMGVFNYVCYTEFSNQIVHGRQVTTRFKQEEMKSDAWFKHK